MAPPDLCTQLAPNTREGAAAPASSCRHLDSLYIGASIAASAEAKDSMQALHVKAIFGLMLFQTRQVMLKCLPS